MVKGDCLLRREEFGSGISVVVVVISAALCKIENEKFTLRGGVGGY